MAAKVLGAVKRPLGAADFASLLLQAQSSNAKVLTVASDDMANIVKQAHEFGLKMKIAVPLLYIMEVHSVELANRHRVRRYLLLGSGRQTRAWSKRFFDRNKKMPTVPQVNAYEGLIII